MLIYFANLIVVVLAAFLARKSKSKNVSRCLLGIAFVSMVLVAGLRDENVGTDSGGYVRSFNRISTFADVMVVGGKMGEYGFYTLNWLLRFVSNEYIILFLTIALIVVGCYMWAILTYSVNIGVSFFVFITMGFYAFFFNGARQGMAAAICIMAIGQLLENNFKKYLGYILVAFLFHKSVIIMLPAFFILNKPNTFKNTLFIVLVGFLTASFYQEIVESMSQIDVRYRAYKVLEPGGGFYMAAFNIVLGIFFYTFKNSIRIDRVRYDRFLNMFLFSVMISAVSSILKSDPSGFLRFTVYLDIAAVFLWPIVFENLTDRLSRFVVGYSFVIFYIVFFVMTTSRFSALVPYIFNPLLRFYDIFS